MVLLGGRAGDRARGECERVSRVRRSFPSGAQFNGFVEISTDFSTKFPVLQGVPHYYKNSVEKSVEKSVEISTKLLN